MISITMISSITLCIRIKHRNVPYHFIRGMFEKLALLLAR